jgi:hypothetical protein
MEGRFGSWSKSAWLFLLPAMGLGLPACASQHPAWSLVILFGRNVFAMTNVSSCAAGRVGSSSKIIVANTVPIRAQAVRRHLLTTSYLARTLSLFSVFFSSLCGVRV